MGKDILMCCGSIMYGKPYRGTIREWKCEKCGKRIGRWSMKELKKDEYDKDPYKINN